MPNVRKTLHHPAGGKDVRRGELGPLRLGKAGLPLVEAGGIIGYGRGERSPDADDLREGAFLVADEEGPRGPGGCDVDVDLDLHGLSF